MFGKAENNRSIFKRALIRCYWFSNIIHDRRLRLNLFRIKCNGYRINGRVEVAFLGLGSVVQTGVPLKPANVDGMARLNWSQKY